MCLAALKNYTEARVQYLDAKEIAKKNNLDTHVFTLVLKLLQSNLQSKDH